MNFNNRQGYLQTPQVEPKKHGVPFVPLTVVLALILLAVVLIGLTPVVGAEPAGAPAVSWASSTYTVTEGTTPLTVTVVLTGTSLMTVTVDVQDTAGTATPTVDYEPMSQTLTFLPEQLTYTLPITIMDNSTVTGDRSFMLVLSNPNQASLGEIITTTITILEDDEMITPTYKAFLPAVYQTANVANERWANEFWRSGTNVGIASTAVDEENNLYIAGKFTYVNDIKASYVAKWDGSQWSPIGTGLANPATQIATGPDGFLYAAELTNCDPWQRCSTFRISQWDGSNWLTISPNITGTISELLVDNQNKVYVTGDFDTIGEEEIANLAIWNGEVWLAFGDGTNNEVRDIVFDSEGHVYISGSFTQAGSTTAPGLAKWNGSQWSAITLHAGMLNAGYLAIDAQDHLYASSWDGMLGHSVFKWDGETWSSISHVGHGMYDLLVSPAGEVYAFGRPSESIDYVFSLSMDSQGVLYAGGSFTSIEGVLVTNIAKKESNQWSDLGGNGLGVNGQVNTVVVANNGDVYIGGAFTYAGSTAVNHIAKWDGENWSALDEGVDGIVHALAFDSQGNLYVGGEFQMAGAVLAPRLAKWDGENWFGIDAINGNVYAIAINSQDHVYIGGDFIITGDTVTNRIAKWDGQDWHSLQNGVGSRVMAIAIDEQDHVYIGGAFTRIAKWDGQNWSNLGTYSLWYKDTPYYNMDGVHDLEFDSNGHLFVTGTFDYVGTRDEVQFWTLGIARWDGQSWHAVDVGLQGEGYYYDRGYELASDSQGNIYVGGYFFEVGSTELRAYYVAQWDGEAWHALGSGVRKPYDDLNYPKRGVYGLAADDQGNLYVGGNFVSAGDKPAVNFSIWQIRE